MCVGCQELATDRILDIVNKGYPLDTAIRLVRDSHIKTGLMDRGGAGVETIDDVQALFDDVTAAGETLTLLQQAVPEAFEILRTGRAALKEES